MRKDHNPNATQQAKKACRPYLAFDPRSNYPLVFARLICGDYRPGRLMSGTDFILSKN